MEVPLEVSQVKQIAGRAGRYGMGVESGVVTTLEPSDLPLLNAAMEGNLEPLRYARVGFISTTIMDIFEALPRGSTATTVRDALLYCSTLPPSMAVMDPSAKEAETMRYIDSFSQDLTFAERALMLQCPFPSMDDQCKAIMGQVLSTYRNKLSVDLRKILLDSGLLATLEQVIASKRTKRVLIRPKKDLASLETLHSVLTIYAWFSLRNILPSSNVSIPLLTDSPYCPEIVLGWSISKTPAPLRDWDGHHLPNTTNCIIQLHFICSV